MKRPVVKIIPLDDSNLEQGISFVTRLNQIPAHKISYPAISFPEPSISYAIEPKAKGDEDKIADALNRLKDEDLGLKLGRDEQTGELLISGSGQLHVEGAASLEPGREAEWGHGIVPLPGTAADGRA